MVFDKKLLIQLRKKTFAGFSDCEKALTACNNDLEEAILWLRKNGIAKANSKFSDEETVDGKIFLNINDSSAILIKLSSKTDFTSNSAEFCKLGDEIAEVINKHKETSIEKANELILKNNESIKNEILNLSSITGEKIELKEISFLSCDEKSSVFAYVHHTKKIGSLIKLSSKIDQENGKNLVVHVAVNSPLFLNSEDVHDEWKQKEKEVALELIKKTNKPIKMHAKIVEEQIKKTISTISLNNQFYLYDSKKTIKEITDNLNTSIIAFKYLSI